MLLVNCNLEDMSENTRIDLVANLFSENSENMIFNLLVVLLVVSLLPVRLLL